MTLADRAQRREGDPGAGLLYLVGAATAIGAVLLAVAGPPQVPTAAPHLPAGAELELLLRTPTAAQLDGALLGLGWLAWLLWALCAWVAFTALFRAAVLLAERAGASWLRPAHQLSDVLTFPAVRRAVDRVLAGLLLARVAAAVATPSAALAATPHPAQVVATPTDYTNGVALAVAEATDQSADRADQIAELGPNDLLYKVQHGDSVGRLAGHFYGDWRAYPRIVEANRDRVQPDGRSLGETGTIHPGWMLVIPEPTHGVKIDEDGKRWYTVERGDTLWAISDELLGDGRRWPEVFELNREQARLDDGHVLRDPNLIWPNLEVKFPRDDRLPAAANPAPVADTEPAAPEAAPAPPPPVTPEALPPAPPPPPSPPPAPRQDVAAEQPTAPPPPAMPEPVATPEPAPAARPTGAPAAAPLAAAAAGGLAAAAIVGGALVVRRRRPAPDLRQPESDVAVEGGYAELDPTQVAAQRLLGGGGDLAGLVAGRLAQAYAHHLDQHLAAEERAALAEVRLLATRHGRTSTTLVLAAPLAARPLLLRQLPAVAELAFGERVDVEGVVSHEGDVLIRLTGVARQAAHLRAAAAAAADGQRPEVWSRLRLVPVGVLNDHQVLAANWDALGHVLVAAPLGQGAGTALVALLAPLLARATPDEVALQVIAADGTLPAELLAVPHLRQPVADPRRPEAVQAALDRVQAELERRRAARPDTDSGSEPELVLVVRELAELDPDAVAILGPILLDGPRHRIRVLAASERPAAELLHACPVLGEFSTRLVLQAADEDESVALLGVAGAETLGAGGQLLVRLEGRLPVQGYGYRVPPDRLARLVDLMDGAAQPPPPPEPAPVRPDPAEKPVPPTDLEPTDKPMDEPFEEPAHATSAASHEEEPAPLAQDAMSARPIQAGDAAPVAEAEPGGTRDPTAPAPAPEDGVPGPVPVGPETANGVHRNGTAAGHPPARAALPRSELLDRLDAAPFQVSCFGARAVRYVPSGQLVYPAPGCPDKPFELLFLVAAHQVAGVRGELVVDSLWPNGLPKEPATELRKLRARLREHLKRLAPDLGDPIPTGNPKTPMELDPSLMASDVHRFLELLRLARTAPREQAIATYEAAISLYGGDLLDRADVPLWWWLYDGPEVAGALRAEYRQLHQEARRRLADLYAAGNADAELRRAQELYIGLAGELAEDERLWAALFRTHGRRGDRLGLEASIRRLRSALAELAEDGDGPDAIAIPPGLGRLIDELRVQLVTSGGAPTDTPQPRG